MLFRSRGFICAIINDVWYRCQLSLDTARYSAFFVDMHFEKQTVSCSPPGVAFVLLVSAGSTAEKHRCGGNGLVLKNVEEVNSAYVGAITRLKTAHPAAKKGRQPLFLQPQWYGADVR